MIFARLALGIAWHLLKAGATSNAPGFDTFKAVVNGGFGPEDVKRATGIAPETLAAIAKAHGGRVEASSRLATEDEPGHSSFTVWLPLTVQGPVNA